MENTIELKSKASKYLDSVLQGKASQSFEEHINETLRNFSGNTAVTLDPKDRNKALSAYFNLVDFPTLLVNKANNILVQKWQAGNETWRKWVRMIPLNDFRPTQISSVGLIPEADEVAPGGTFTNKNNLQGEAVMAQLATFGNLVRLERETFLNDRNGGFDSFLSDLALSYDRKIGKRVYELLTTNPVSFDTREIFHADHGNIVTQTASFEDDLSAAIQRMYAQTFNVSEADDSMQNNESVSLVPRFVLVPPSKAIQASKTVNSLNEGLAEDQRLEVVIERRLIGFDGWFLASDINTLTIAAFHLSGNEGPTLQQRTFHSNNGMEAKHYYDMDVKPVDYRGLVRVA